MYYKKPDVPPGKDNLKILGAKANIDARTRSQTGESIIDNLFPFISGAEIKDHVLINNWANGWVLRQGSAR